jgi:hypothetical protein
VAWDDLSAYFWSLWGYARWLLAGGPFFVDTLLKRIWPEAAKRLDSLASPSLRRNIEIMMIIVALFAASFLAWKDEHHARLIAEGHREDAHVNRAILELDNVSKDQVAGDGLYFVQLLFANIGTLSATNVKIRAAAKFSDVELSKDEIALQIVYAYLKDADKQKESGGYVEPARGAIVHASRWGSAPSNDSILIIKPETWTSVVDGKTVLYIVYVERWGDEATDGF